MAADAGSIRVTVAYSPAPRRVDLRELTVRPGTTAGEALVASGLLESHPSLRDRPVPLAVWGRAAAATQVLRERDRVEVLRPLQVDPKVARRERFARQGARAAGLFAKKPGKR